MSTDTVAGVFLIFTETEKCALMIVSTTNYAIGAKGSIFGINIMHIFKRRIESKLLFLRVQASYLFKKLFLASPGKIV